MEITTGISAPPIGIINRNPNKKDIIIKTADLYFKLINAKNNLIAGSIKSDFMLAQYNSAKKLFNNGYISNIELNKHKNNFDIATVEEQILTNELDVIKQDVFIFTGKEIMDIHNLNHMIDIPLTSYDADSLVVKAMVSFDSIKSAPLDAVSYTHLTLPKNREV